MLPESVKLLEDMRLSIDDILEITSHMTFAEYEESKVIRLAVERAFEILGEALNRLWKSDPSTAIVIPEHRRIIDFRNVLIHGYNNIDEQVVWDVVQNDLANLQRGILGMLPK